MWGGGGKDEEVVEAEEDEAEEEVEAEKDITTLTRSNLECAAGYSCSRRRLVSRCRFRLLPWYTAKSTKCAMPLPLAKCEV